MNVEGRTQEMSAAPIRPEPMYPAGKVIFHSAQFPTRRRQLTIGTPPRILVDPPSLGNNCPSAILHSNHREGVYADILNLGACDDLSFSLFRPLLWP
jgi:hypothetical protein